jgi:hypothetical protein
VSDVQSHLANPSALHHLPDCIAVTKSKVDESINVQIGDVFETAMF